MRESVASAKRRASPEERRRRVDVGNGGFDVVPAGRVDPPGSAVFRPPDGARVETLDVSKLAMLERLDLDCNVRGVAGATSLHALSVGSVEAEASGRTAHALDRLEALRLGCLGASRVEVLDESYFEHLVDLTPIAGLSPLRELISSPPV